MPSTPEQRQAVKQQAKQIAEANGLKWEELSKEDRKQWTKQARQKRRNSLNAGEESQ